MTITNQPIEPGQPVQFIVTGFPDEEAVKAAVERFYKIKADADRRFLVHNEFGEQIMSGGMDGEGRIENFSHNERPSKHHPMAEKKEEKGEL